jgi:hypothetical protein
MDQNKPLKRALDALARRGLVLGADTSMDTLLERLVVACDTLDACERVQGGGGGLPPQDNRQPMEMGFSPRDERTVNAILAHNWD